MSAPPRIGIDATSWGNRRGFGRFGRNVVRRLVELDGDFEYVLFVEGHDEAPDLPDGARVRRVATARPSDRAAAAGSNRSPADLLRLAVAARRADLRAFVFPSVYTYFPVLGVPTVVGVHDAIARDLPDLTMPSRRARALWFAKESLAVRRAARVFTVSETSRDVLVDRFGLSRDRLAVVPEAADAVFAPRAPDAVRAELAPLGLDGRPFLLYAGGISPHKDVVTLIDAYARLVAAVADPPVLVVAGDLERDPYLSSAADVRARIAAHRLQERVVTPGFVSDERLACLYSAATAVALPSLAEGFGLPAVEAAACGAPVLLSDIAAHRETMGDSARYFPPRDAGALAALLAEVAGDEALRERMGEAGRRRVASLSWDAAARALRSVVVEAAA